ncbi:HIT family protein [Eudoraea sp.]|uniref:HIT family protein n=1 Tax=Eudoraea sp. TaxID=1979955 RepID=UPI003C7731D0
MATIFSKIISGDIPAYKIAENDDFLAFLDINPNAKGHTLCIPKLEIDKITQMDEAHFLGLMKFSRKVALAIEKAIECKRIGFSVIGLEVPHVHVHLIPLNSMANANFQNKEVFNEVEFIEIADSIKTHLK